MQSSSSDLKYAAKKKLKRRDDRFLAGIHAAMPWAALKAEIEPFYPKGEGRGCPPIGLLKRSVRKAQPADELGWLQDRFEKL